MDSSAIDFLDENAILHALKSCMPSVVVNCAAFTAVDAAEEHHDRAIKVNSDAVRVTARWAKANRQRLFMFQQILYLMEQRNCLTCLPINLTH